MSRSPRILERQDLGFLHFVEEGYETEFRETISELSNDWCVIYVPLHTEEQLETTEFTFFHYIGAEHNSAASATERVQALSADVLGVLVVFEVVKNITLFKITDLIEILQYCNIANRSIDKHFRALFIFGLR
ncbi:MAG: hypothetical protein ABIW16_00430 [Sphingomicrobium sp.]